MQLVTLETEFFLLADSNECINKNLWFAAGMFSRKWAEMISFYFSDEILKQSILSV